jgi:hypothetical protein
MHAFVEPMASSGVYERIGANTDGMDPAVAQGPRLKAYLARERAMADLDDAGDPLRDGLRDLMDEMWLKLSTEDREALDSRQGDIRGS